MQPSTIELNNPHPPQLTIPNLSPFFLHTAARNALRQQIVVLPLPAVLGPGAFVLNAQRDGDQQVNVASGTFRGIANRTEAMRKPLMVMLEAAAASGTPAGAPPPLMEMLEAAAASGTPAGAPPLYSIRNVHSLAYPFVPQGAYKISFKLGSFTQPGYYIAGNMCELQKALGTCQKYGLSINDDGKLLVPAGGVMCEMGLHGDGREGVAAKAIGCIGLPPGAFAGLRLDVALVGDAGIRVGDIMQCVIAKAAGQCLFAKMDCLAGDVPIASLKVGEGEGANKYTLVAKAHSLPRAVSKSPFRIRLGAVPLSVEPATNRRPSMYTLPGPSR